LGLLLPKLVKPSGQVIIRDLYLFLEFISTKSL
jgi:hypothetical protein